MASSIESVQPGMAPAGASPGVAAEAARQGAKKARQKGLGRSAMNNAFSSASSGLSDWGSKAKKGVKGAKDAFNNKAADITDKVMGGLSRALGRFSSGLSKDLDLGFD